MFVIGPPTLKPAMNMTYVITSPHCRYNTAMANPDLKSKEIIAPLTARYLRLYKLLLCVIFQYCNVCAINTQTRQIYSLKFSICFCLCLLEYMRSYTGMCEWCLCLLEYMRSYTGMCEWCLCDRHNFIICITE